VSSNCGHLEVLSYIASGSLEVLKQVELEHNCDQINKETGKNINEKKKFIY
jgi:hypothetical protein